MPLDYVKREIDHTNGHAFSHNGDIFYSPNCSRRISIPEDDGGLKYPFHTTTAKIETFLQPRWWSLPYPFFPFVPLRPSFSGPIFEVLQISPDIYDEAPGSNILRRQTCRKWINLENRLLQVVCHLRDEYYTVPFLKPIIPSMLGFEKEFYNSRSLRRRVKICRNWFGMWMALISFLIAQTQTYYQLEAEERENWFTVLSERGMPQSWLSGLQTSEVATFSSNNARVGVILDFLSNLPRQPPVEWYCYFNIPVWYPWSKRHEKATHARPDLEHLRPPVHILQEIHTFLSRTPSMTTPLSTSPNIAAKDSHHMTDKEFSDARDAVLCSEPWTKFFDVRKIRNALIMAKEGPIDKERRLNRERLPPQASAEVYRWEWSESNPLEFVRVRVSKRERMDVLESHSKAQCIYDSVSNTWDVCEEFGPDDECSDSEDGNGSHDEDGGSNGEDPFPNMDADEEQAAHEAYFESKTESISDHTPETTSEISIHDPEYSDNLDIVRYITLHYGFIPPIPMSGSQHPLPTKDWNDCLKTIGLRSPTEYPNIPDEQANCVHNFVRTLLNPPGTTVETWDLSRNHCRSITPQMLRRSFHPLPGRYVLVPVAFQEKLTKDQEFWIAFPSPDAALYVYRLLHTDTHTLSTLSTYLAEKGIQFSTLLCLEPRPSTISLSGIKTTIPKRIAGYVFKPSDYEIYVKQRVQILSSPRGRAALLHGGIVARIAREHLAPDAVSMGPSSAVQDYRLGLCIGDPHNSQDFYYDDKLTDQELDMICGMHDLETGRSNQIAKVSWWPSAATWGSTANGLNRHYWTDQNEEWYQERLSLIISGDKLGVPINQQKWRDKLKGASAWRKINKVIVTQSEDLFE